MPIEHSRTLTIPQVEERAKKLSPRQIDKVEKYEQRHKQRKGAIGALEKTKQRQKQAA